MTHEQLKEGNELKDLLRQKEESLHSLKQVLKRIDLEQGFIPKWIELSIDGIRTSVERDEIKEFLWKQVNDTEKQMKEVENKFKSI